MLFVHSGSRLASFLRTQAVQAALSDFQPGQYWSSFFSHPLPSLCAVDRRGTMRRARTRSSGILSWLRVGWAPYMPNDLMGDRVVPDLDLERTRRSRVASCWCRVLLELRWNPHLIF